MRILLSVAAAASLLASSFTVSAQEAGGSAHTSSKDFHIGIGAGFSLLSPVLIGDAVEFAGPFGGGSLVVPLDIAGVVRIEPELAFAHSSQGDDTTSSSGTAVRVAAGIFWMFPISDDAQGTLGARLGPQFLSSSEELDPGDGTTITTTRSSINFAAGPAFGGEYFFSEHFSLGAEAQVNFMFRGEESIDVDPGPDPGSNDVTGFSANTNAVIFARVFFL